MDQRAQVVCVRPRVGLPGTVGRRRGPAAARDPVEGHAMLLGPILYLRDYRFAPIGVPRIVEPHPPEELAGGGKPMCGREALLQGPGQLGSLRGYEFARQFLLELSAGARNRNKSLRLRSD